MATKDSHSKRRELSDEQFYFFLSAALLVVVFSLYAIAVLEGLPS